MHIQNTMKYGPILGFCTICRNIAMFYEIVQRTRVSEIHLPKLENSEATLGFCTSCRKLAIFYENFQRGRPETPESSRELRRAPENSREIQSNQRAPESSRELQRAPGDAARILGLLLDRF